MSYFWPHGYVLEGCWLNGVACWRYSDPTALLGGVRLPPDTEIIKYTSSIVGPKIPGTTNRGRKKTISLDPPSVSVLPTHSSTGLLIERADSRSSQAQRRNRPLVGTQYSRLCNICF